jgi:hypothetical protein
VFQPLLAAPPRTAAEADRIRREIEELEASHKYSAIPAVQPVDPADPSDGMIHYKIENATGYALTVQIVGAVSQEVILPPATVRTVTLPVGVFKIAARVPADVLPSFGTQVFEAGHDYQSHFFLDNSAFFR